jgi:hypothetical protein
MVMPAYNAEKNIGKKQFRTSPKALPLRSSLSMIAAKTTLQK